MAYEEKSIPDLNGYSLVNAVWWDDIDPPTLPITWTGLDGESDREYRLVVRCKVNSATGIYCRYNNDTGGNYNWTEHYAYETNHSYSNAAGSTYMKLSSQVTADTINFAYDVRMGAVYTEGVSHTHWRLTHSIGNFQCLTGSPARFQNQINGYWVSGSALSSITFGVVSGTNPVIQEGYVALFKIIPNWK